MEAKKKEEFSAPYVKGFIKRKRETLEVEYDTVRPGLSLRGFPTGGARWKYHYRFKDRPRVYSIGDAEKISLSDARDKCRELDSKIFHGLDPQTEKTAARKTGTFREVVENYLAAKKGVLKESGLALYRRVLWGCDKGKKGGKTFKFSDAQKRFGNWKITEITNTDVFDFLKPIKTKAPGTARALVAALGSVFKWATTLEGGNMKFKEDPLNGITREKSRVRESVLSDDLIPKFWTAIDEEGLIPSTALKVILVCGQRPGEVLSMRWEHLKIGVHPFDEKKPGTIAEMIKVTHEGAWWEMPGEPTVEGWPGTKTKKDHKVWLTPEAVSLVLENSETGEPEKSGFVFKSPMNPNKAHRKLDFYMRNVCKKLGVKASTYRPHDLRRTFGTMATTLKLGRDAMGRVLNHARPGENESDKHYDFNKYLDEFYLVAMTITERIKILLGRAGVPFLLARAQKEKKAKSA